MLITRVSAKGSKDTQCSIPKGKHSVRVANYGPKTMFPDPNLKDYVPYPFTITVIEPAITFELKLSDLSSLLLTTQIQKIKESIRNEPTDSEVIQMWIQKHEKQIYL